jgi:nucleoside-diphosphate-sugar epimerase
MSTSNKTILFIGATGGCGLSALRRSLKAGHTCIALCRTPSKLSSQLPKDMQTNLRIVQGNAHDVSAVSPCLVHPSDPSRTVDMVITSIGGAFSLKTGLDDHHVCENGMKTLLEALSTVRKNGASGRPRIVALSSTGLTMHRDLPILMIPLYKGLLGIPHKDKKAMEDLLARSDEDYTLIRGSFYTDGDETDGKVRVGMEDIPSGKIESTAIGYTISREDVGKWIFENLVQESSPKWVKKAATITY